MGINEILLSLLAIALLTHTYFAYTMVSQNKIPSELPWVPIQVGKTKVYTNQTRDAGMYIERQRRTAIIQNASGKVGYKGSTNGSLEWNFLTGICVCPPRGPVCPPAPNVIWSDGDADDEICDIVDAGGAFGGYDVIDFGGADTNDCAI